MSVRTSPPSIGPARPTCGRVSHPWRGGRFLAGLAGFAALAVACGSTAEPVAPEADASARFEDAAPSPIDAVDAGREDAAVLPAPGFVSCEAARARASVRFCDDFDDGDLANDWTVANAAPAGRALVDLSLEARSGPYALYATTEATTDGASATASLRKTILFDATTTRAELSFAVFVPSASVGKGSAAFAGLDVTTNHFFTLFLKDADPDAPGPSLEETTTAGTKRTKLPSAPRAGAWTRVSLRLDLAAGTADLAYDAVPVLSKIPIAPGPLTEATFRVGAFYVVGPTPKLEVVIDDVLLEAF